MKKIISVLGGILMGSFLVFVLVVTSRITEAKHVFVLANDFTLLLGTRKPIEQFDENAFHQESLDGFAIHRGWFYRAKKTAIVYTLHPNAVTPMDMSTMPGLFVKACNGTLEKTDLDHLGPEARAVAGTIFHELVAHGSDGYCRGKPLTMIHLLWPNTPDPGNETVQNPWKIVRKYWGSDATHPLLETQEYVESH